MKKLFKIFMLGFVVLNMGVMIHASESDDQVSKEAVLEETVVAEDVAEDAVPEEVVAAELDVAPELKVEEVVVPETQVETTPQGYDTFNWWLPIVALILTIGLLYLARDAARKYVKKQKRHHREKNIHQAHSKHQKPHIGYEEIEENE